MKYSNKDALGGRTMDDEYFKVNSKYSVKKYVVSNTQFFQGEKLTYIGGGYSRFEDCYIYDFLTENGVNKEYFAKKKYDHEKDGIFEIVLESGNKSEDKTIDQ